MWAIHTDLTLSGGLCKEYTALNPKPYIGNSAKMALNLGFCILNYPGMWVCRIPLKGYRRCIRVGLGFRVMLTSHKRLDT